MRKFPIFDAALIILILIFSWWLMGKSFGYDTGSSQFRVARHEVGDFGLHLSLIRSFAWGNNSPPQLPFFAGEPLVYHHGFDWIIGQLVRRGIRIDYALNGPSAVAMTILLYGLYRLTTLLSKGSNIAGILSVVLFILSGNLSFVEILKQVPKDLSFFAYLWRFPDYIHKGPFDGSLITIYTTLSPYLNQRHLIVGTAIGVILIWLIVGWLRSNKEVSVVRWILVGFLLGIAARIHVLVAGATAVLLVALLLGKHNKAIVIIAGTALLTASFQLLPIISIKSAGRLTWNPGYLAPRPFSLASWVSFWIYNLGILIILIPLAYRQTNELGRRLLMGAGALFIIANLVQLSFRIEHNHSLINYAEVITIPFVVTLLVRWWTKRSFGWKLVVIIAFLLATISGLFNLMVVKNDYQTMIDDAPKNTFLSWVQQQTDPGSIFISTHALYDPVTLAGRKNYLGQEYYVTVMGYDYWGRRKQIDSWLTNVSQETIAEMKAQDIDYVVIPKERTEFPYDADEEKLKALLPVVYRDESVTAYAL